MGVTQMDDYRDVIGSPTPEAFIQLRKAVGWPVPTRTAAAKALAKDLFSVSIQRAGECVACGRIVGDGTLVFYVQDVMVLPDHQCMGLGTRIMDRLMTYINANAEVGAFIALFSAPPVVNWYARYGFQPRPNEERGPGMAFFKT